VEELMAHKFCLTMKPLVLSVIIFTTNKNIFKRA